MGILAVEGLLGWQDLAAVPGRELRKLPAEQAAGERSGDQGADLEDPDPVERACRR